MLNIGNKFLPFCACKQNVLANTARIMVAFVLERMTVKELPTFLINMRGQPIRKQVMGIKDVIQDDRIVRVAESFFVKVEE